MDSSLKYLLEETNLDLDLDILFDDGSKTSGVKQDILDGANTDFSLSTFNEAIFLDSSHPKNELSDDWNRDEMFVPNLQRPGYIDSLDMGSHTCTTEWSSMSGDCTSDFTLDFDSAPLSLEELFTRTFNDKLENPIPTDHSHSNSFTSSEDSSWTDTWHSDFLEVSPPLSTIVSVNDYIPTGDIQDLFDVNEEDKRNPADCYQLDSEQFQVAGEYEGNSQKLKTAENSVRDSKKEKSKQYSDSSPDSIASSTSTEHRLARVRKYQRIVKYSSSSLVERHFQCTYPECAKLYAKSSHLKAHLRRHSGKRSFKCDWQECQWQFSRSDELARHRRSHYGIKPYPCSLCTKRFTRSDHLAKHLKVHERQKLRQSFKNLRQMKKKQKVVA